MKVVKADLLDDVVTSYDQTKTTVFGRVAVKTVDGDDALGPPLNKFVDVFTDAGVTPAGTFYISDEGRIFTIVAETSGLSVMTLHTLDFDTGDVVYNGKIQINLPDTAATTTAFKFIKAITTGTTGWKIFVGTTASVLINGGAFLVNKIDLADFIQVGFPTIPFATGNDQKAVYFLQDPAAIGAGQLNIASVGAVLDHVASRLYVHNGISATHQYYVYDTSSAPTFSTNAITGTEATNLINDAGHAFVNGDPLRFVTITGGAGLTAGTVYFVVSAVAGVSYQLSATSGGAAVNFTTDISSGTIGRAFGTTGSNFVHKTGNLTALSGTLLSNDAEDLATPGHTSLSGQKCAFFATGTNLYLGLLSELTSGATTWSSLQTVNLLGSANQIVAPTCINAGWSDALDRALYVTNTNIIVVKEFLNNSIEILMGGSNNEYTEGVVNNETVEFQLISFTGLDVGSGWLGVVGNSTGQRGIFLTDILSNYQYASCYVTTKVMDTPSATYKFVTTTDKLFEYTGSLIAYYRTSGFATESGGWTEIPFATELSGFAAGSQVQIKFEWDTMGFDTCIHAQLTDVYLAYSSLNEISENWEFQYDDTESSTPTRVAFRLKKAYNTSVPELFFRAYSTTDTLIAEHSTTANAGFFEYSTDSGETWNALGTIPNTVGTLLRYEFSSQPGQDIRPSIREA
jgi:hypothetical protein